MNTVREWIPNPEDPYECVMSISDWEYAVRDGLFIDYDGFGYFCDPLMKTEDYGFCVSPSMFGSVAYNERKAHWTHINWFNR